MTSASASSEAMRQSDAAQGWTDEGGGERGDGHENREQEVWCKLKLYRWHLSDQAIKRQVHLGFSG